MKTILVPTDFSKNSLNALDYAVEIAKLTKAKIILFNVYQIPFAVSEAPIILPIEEIENDFMERLREIEKNIQLKHGGELIIECTCRCGFPIDEINILSEETKTDLIVMEMEGAGLLTEKLIGSTTTSLIKKAKCPVLAIGNDVKFKNLKKIAFAFDNIEMKNELVLSPLKEFANLFKSHVYILNVVQPQLKTVQTINDAAEDIKITRLLDGIENSFCQIHNENIIEGISDFADEKNIDMVVMIPHVHTALHNLFNQPQTKRMAFHTKIPLLALHE